MMTTEDENKVKKFMTEYHAIVPNEEYNLFEAVPLHEFRHSEILYRLLSYEVSGRFPFLESFLRRLSIDMTTWDFSCKAIHISREEHIDGRPVDVLVVCKNKNAALIIENKCCNACDMGGQLHDYIDNVKKKYSVAEDRLTCLYLRRIDSLENPGTASVVDDSHASLVTVSSYREQIVPWLKDDVLRNLRYASGVMVSSLIAYIDILESWSGARARTIGESARIVAEFKSIFGCQGSEAYSICKRILSNLEQNQDVGAEETISVLRTVKQILWESDPMLDSYDLAEELKWMLKNNPYPYGRTIMHCRLECGEMFDYSSIGRWYNVVKAERDAVAPDGSVIKVRIHMNCGNLSSADSETQKSIIYGGVCQSVVDLPAYNDIMYDLESSGYERYGRPEDNSGFFFAAGSKLLSNFKCNGPGREIIWSIARNFALAAKLYSEVLRKHGYKPVLR